MTAPREVRRRLTNWRIDRKRFAGVVLVFLLAVSLASGRDRQPTQADERVVIVPVANVYSSPTEDADVVSQAILGSNVGVLELQKDWAKVRTSDQYTGWMPLSASIQQNGGAYASKGRVVQVESLFANLYRETDVTQHQPLITAPFETRLEVIKEGTGDDAGWLLVGLPDGRSAWVQSSDVNPASKALTIDESIASPSDSLDFPIYGVVAPVTDTTAQASPKCWCAVAESTCRAMPTSRRHGRECRSSSERTCVLAICCFSDRVLTRLPIPRCTSAMEKSSMPQPTDIR